MAKMMMGQIDHARKRVAELKAAKYGDSPNPPKLRGGSDILKAMRAGEITPTAPQVKKAFAAFVDETVSAQVEEQSGSYSNNYTSTYRIARRTPASVQDALATLVYIKENTAEVERFEQETELYNLRQEAINIKATEVEDAIVLGDQHAALIALQEFTVFEV